MELIKPALLLVVLFNIDSVPDSLVQDLLSILEICWEFRVQLLGEIKKELARWASVIRRHINKFP